MTKILLVRHGETEWNAARRIQGHTNSDLSARGRRQAEAVAARLSRLSVAAVYASDLSRACDTALAIAAPHGLPVITTPDLREKSYGEWEGMTEVEVKSHSPDGWHRYHVLRDLDYVVPGGETWEEVRARMLDVYRRVLRDHPGPDETVVLVGHGGALRPLILDALGAPLSMLMRFRMDNTGVSLLESSPARGGRIGFLNDTGHLEALDEASTSGEAQVED